MTFKSKLLIIISLIFSQNAFSSTKCIAHRGDNKYFMENSFSALYSAIEKKSHGVEFDIVHTQDNVALVMHDDTLIRLAKSKEGFSCDLTSKISSLAYNDIKENCILQNDEEIPTLKEFLSILKPLQTMRFIELKDKASSQV